MAQLDLGYSEEEEGGGVALHERLGGLALRSVRAAPLACDEEQAHADSAAQSAAQGAAQSAAAERGAERGA